MVAQTSHTWETNPNDTLGQCLPSNYDNPHSASTEYTARQSASLIYVEQRKHASVDAAGVILCKSHFNDTTCQDRTGQRRPLGAIALVRHNSMLYDYEREEEETKKANTKLGQFSGNKTPRLTQAGLCANKTANHTPGAPQAQ